MKSKNPPVWTSAVRARLRRKLAAWFAKNGRDLPWRRTSDPYAIMVSEFMLQQTQVATVLGFFERWLQRFPDFKTLAAAAEDDVLHAWQGLGYYSRARNLHRAAQRVVAEHGGELPPDAAAIAKLPGVGRYTAGAIASFAFDQPVAAVDANIARVLARLLDFREPIDAPAGQAAIWQAAEELLPESGGRIHTSALMELGALVCTPRAPRCESCPVRVECRASEPESLPAKKPRRQTVRVLEECAWIVEGGRVLLEQQRGRRWGGMWKLPLLASASAEKPKPLAEFDYPFTHHRVTLRVFASKAPEPSENQAWQRIDGLGGLAITSPHRRAIEAILG